MEKLILSLSVVFLSSAAMAGDSEQQTSFDTPSHNICCTYTPAGGTQVYSTPDGSAELSCHRVLPKYWILSFTEKGKLKIYKNPGEVPGCGYSDVLGYGQSRTDGLFTCVSTASGLVCTANGKGFKLSKSGVKKIN